ncbi:hypothetical protein TWF718_009621 [Orbilia javanica]|uniref:Uncharacterized protein n=1 Tax=Orbilia javanica TaxID=47235 RepID=A0AAN8MU10_9PEZI
MCGVLRCPKNGNQPMELWLGTTPPRKTGDEKMKKNAKEARVKLAAETGVWSDQVGRFPVGSCAETIPLSILLRSGTRESDMYSLSIRNKDGEYIQACQTCTATLENAASITGFTILDVGLPENRWVYGEGERAAQNRARDLGGGPADAKENREL